MKIIPSETVQYIFLSNNVQFCFRWRVHPLSNYGCYFWYLFSSSIVILVACSLTSKSNLLQNFASVLHFTYTLFGVNMNSPFSWKHVLFDFLQTNVMLIVCQRRMCLERLNIGSNRQRYSLGIWVKTKSEKHHQDHVLKLLFTHSRSWHTHEGDSILKSSYTATLEMLSENVTALYIAKWIHK